MGKDRQGRSIVAEDDEHLEDLYESRGAANPIEPISPTWPCRQFVESFPECQNRFVSPEFRRINIQHRLVYQVLNDARVVKVIRMWTRYE